MIVSRMSLMNNQKFRCVNPILGKEGATADIQVTPEHQASQVYE